QRAGRYDLDVPRGDRIAETHDRALAELLFDLAEGRCQGSLTVVIHRVFLRIERWIRGAAAPGRPKERRLFHRIPVRTAAFSRHSTRIRKKAKKGSGPFFSYDLPFSRERSKKGP